MIEKIDFSNWSVYQGNSEGSGRSEKIWLCSDNESGLFKFPKTEHTTEHVSEKLASNIAKLLEIPCAKIDIGTYHGRTGSMSYRINNEKQALLEAIVFISKALPNYDIDRLCDYTENIYYSFPLIYRIAEVLNLEKDFFNMLIFDALIGNSDRHHSNWAVLVSPPGSIEFSPLYDNGSSLCCYVNEADIDSYLGKDILRFNGLVDTRSRSRIRIHLNDKKEPTHREMLEHLSSSKHRCYCEDTIEKINQNITSQKIIDMLNEYSDDLLSTKKKELISKFLNEKIKIINNVFKGG